MRKQTKTKNIKKARDNSKVLAVVLATVKVFWFKLDILVLSSSNKEARGSATDLIITLSPLERLWDAEVTTAGLACVIPVIVRGLSKVR